MKLNANQERNYEILKGKLKKQLNDRMVVKHFLNKRRNYFTLIIRKYESEITSAVFIMEQYENERMYVEYYINENGYDGEETYYIHFDKNTQNIPLTVDDILDIIELKYTAILD